MPNHIPLALLIFFISCFFFANIDANKFNPRTAGGLSYLRTAGGWGGGGGLQENSKIKKDSEKR